MAAGKDQCLQHQRHRDAAAPPAQPLTDQSGACQRHGAKQRFFPSAGHQGLGNRPQRGPPGGEDIGVHQRVSWHPPAELRSRYQVETNRQQQFKAGPGVAAQRASHGLRAGSGGHTPEIEQPRLIGKSAPAQALGHGKDQAQ